MTFLKACFLVVVVVAADAADICASSPGGCMAKPEADPNTLLQTHVGVGALDKASGVNVKGLAMLKDEQMSDTLADTIKAEISTKDKLAAFKSSLGEGIAHALVQALRGDATPDEIRKASYDSGIAICSSLASMVNPLLGIAVVFAMTLLQGCFFETTSVSDQMADLYKTIMKQVGTLIEQNNVNQQMTSVKNQILGTTEELSWAPELVETASDDVMMSYYLTVQHGLAVNARTAFGDCYDSLSSTACKKWQQAGTVDISTEYAQLHLTVLTGMSALDSASDQFRTLVRAKITSTAKKYKCLLLQSYDTFKTYRNDGDRFDITLKVDYDDKGVKYNFCDWSVKIKDKYTGDWVAKTTTCGQKQCSTKYKSRNKCKDAAKDWRNGKVNKYKASMTSDLKSLYKDPIDKLFDGVLSGSDSSNPCGR